MNEHKNGGGVLVGQVLEDSYMISITDLCRSCLVKTETVTLLVSEGILDPMGDDVEDWRFQINSLKRVKTAINLQRDLGVNLAGAALALDLLDRIEKLESKG